MRDPGSQPDSPGWTVRVVPNKFPALEADIRPHSTRRSTHRQLAAHGFHEVVIETPRHDCGFGDLSLEELETVLAVYRGRLQVLSREPHVRSVVLFRNEGQAAGASQMHPHAQILALPMVPSRLGNEVAAAARYWRRRGCCLACEMVERERRHNLRFIAQNADFVALSAFAPRFPYETWVLPVSHGHDFSQVSGRQLGSLAAMLRQVLSGLASILGRFPFNLVLHTAPALVDSRMERAFHWRFEILPRVTTPSGFELGSDTFIVAVSPEEAARRLRSLLPADEPAG